MKLNVFLAKLRIWKANLRIWINEASCLGIEASSLKNEPSYMDQRNFVSEKRTFVSERRSSVSVNRSLEFCQTQFIIKKRSVLPTAKNGNKYFSFPFGKTPKQFGYAESHLITMPQYAIFEITLKVEIRRSRIAGGRNG